MTDLFCEDNIHEHWIEKENYYLSLVKPQNLDLDLKLESFSISDLEKMNGNEFFDFLYNEYFVWKFTAKNRLSTTRAQLVKHQENMLELQDIKDELLNFNLSNIEEGLKIATRIKGLGPAGASGLLAIIFPKYFGTVDQFVLKSLLTFDCFKTNPMLNKMNPDAITVKDATILISILREKSSMLNSVNNTTYWTPRKIDKILWALGR